MRARRMWYRCLTCDVRYLARSVASLEHNKPDCKVVSEGYES